MARKRRRKSEEMTDQEALGKLFPKRVIRKADKEIEDADQKSVSPRKKRGSK